MPKSHKNLRQLLNIKHPVKSHLYSAAAKSLNVKATVYRFLNVQINNECLKLKKAS